MVGRCLIIYFISKHAHVHSDLISVAEIKYRFYIYRIYFWTAEEAYCMKITCPLHLPVQCHSSEYNPPILWHWHSVGVQVQHVPTVEYMSPWPSLHVQTWRYGCPRARLWWPVAEGGAGRHNCAGTGAATVTLYSSTFPWAQGEGGDFFTKKLPF